jgi:hypothetical protein
MENKNELIQKNTYESGCSKMSSSEEVRLRPITGTIHYRKSSNRFPQDKLCNNK